MLERPLSQVGLGGSLQDGGGGKLPGLKDDPVVLGRHHLGGDNIKALKMNPKTFLSYVGDMLNA